jgi:hypothetical protein
MNATVPRTTELTELVAGAWYDAAQPGNSHVLKLDNVPNTVPSKDHPGEDDLGGVPNAVDAAFYSAGRGGEHSMHFVIWPAHVGEKHINVRISTQELSRISGDRFEVDSEKITPALRTHRAKIEQRANEMLTPGATEITLDLDSLR